MAQETHTVCCYCGVGCGVVIESDRQRITGVRGDPAHPANFGRLCTKGATLAMTAATTAGRALYPELRASRAAPRQRVNWDAALDATAVKFAQVIREHGPDAVAFYLSGQLLTEDYYVFNKLARGLIGTNNVDSNSRLCMSSAVTGYKATLGADSPPCAYEDVDHAATIFIAGSNTAFAHPVLFRRIEAAKEKNSALKLIVVDPRRTDTAAAADLFLPILPGTDVALFNAMLHVMLWERLVDEDYIAAHTGGFEALRDVVRDMSPAVAANVCGVPADDIVRAARLFAQGPTLSLWCQGLNQSSCGTEKNAALINLHLATGQIGKPGAGPFSLTGQPNAMGGRETGAMATLMSAHRDLADPRQRDEVARLWGVDNVPATPGLTAVELFDAMHDGRVKAVWIACTNPAQSMPDQERVWTALERCEWVVVQEAYADTETARFADVLLPAATWGEKEGTVTNSERRISRVRAAVAPPGEARADWAIAVDFARRLEKLLCVAPATPPALHDSRLFPYTSAEAIWNEHRDTTRGLDLDITGLSYRILQTDGPQQWPYPTGHVAGRVRLYEDGIFPSADGRARFMAAPYRPVAEKVDARFPFALNTGRLRDHWHGMSRTGKLARLFGHAPEPVVSMARVDMERLGIRDDEIVRVKSRRGEVVLRAAAADEVRPGQAFLPMHWGAGFVSGKGVNAVTLPVCDPDSLQPELKHAAVRIERVKLPFEVTAMVRGRAVERRHQLAALVENLPCASLTLAGRDNAVLTLRAAAGEPFSAAWLELLDATLALDDPSTVLAYDDAGRGVSKRVRVEDGKVTAVRLAGETAAREWLLDNMTRGDDASAIRAWTLAPFAAPPTGIAARGRVVCNCLDVTEPAIVAAIAGGLDVAGLKAELKCGTECGSCVPELKRLVASATQESAPTARQGSHAAAA